MTHIKQQKILLTSNIYGAYIIAIDLRYSPMTLHANSCLMSMGCYLHTRLKYIQKHMAYAASYNNIKAYVKGLFVRATKHWSIVGPVRQS